MVGRDPRVIGTRIARRRHQLGWTQIELAERLGVSPSTVANWERGASYPKKKFGKVEQVLSIRLDDEPVPEPEPLIPDSLMATIRRELSPEDQEIAIDALERALGPRPPAEEGGSSGRARRAG